MKRFVLEAVLTSLGLDAGPPPALLPAGCPVPAMVTEAAPAPFLEAPSLVLAAPSSLVLAFFWRSISSVQELLRRWFLREEAWTTEG